MKKQTSSKRKSSGPIRIVGALVKSVLVILVLLLVTVPLAIYVGARRWQGRTESIRARLDTADRTIQPATYDPAELEGLPTPVQRYFEAVLQPGGPMVAEVFMEHTGTFNLDTEGAQWVPFRSEQWVNPKQPGFVWNARMVVLGFLPIWVHDAYVATEGLLNASLFGLLSMVNQAGTPDMAQGELLRYLAETPWYPTALLPSQGVTWRAVDEHSAQVTIKDGDVTATMLFHFNADGLIDWVRAEARARAIEGGVEYTPWEGRWRNYRKVDGMMVPESGEVFWLLPEGELPYWRGRVTQYDYTFAE